MVLVCEKPPRGAAKGGRLLAAAVGEGADAGLQLGLVNLAIRAALVTGLLAVVAVVVALAVLRVRLRAGGGEELVAAAD